MAERCGHERDDGSACQSTVGLCSDPDCGCGHCANHCPARREAMQRARSRGGTASTRKKEARRLDAKYKPAVNVPPPPETAEDAKRYLSWILDAAARGELGGSLARDLSTVADRFLRAVGTADLERQMAEMRREMEAMREGGP